MRKIHELVFMGQGLMSLGKIYEAHKVLDEAFSDLGAVQQLTHSTTAEEAKRAENMRKGMKVGVEDAVRDIAMALTGKEIQFR